MVRPFPEGRHSRQFFRQLLVRVPSTASPQLERDRTSIRTTFTLRFTDPGSRKATRGDDRVWVLEVESFCPGGTCVFQRSTISVPIRSTHVVCDTFSSRPPMHIHLFRGPSGMCWAQILHDEDRLLLSVFKLMMLMWPVFFLVFRVTTTAFCCSQSVLSSLGGSCMFQISIHLEYIAVSV